VARCAIFQIKSELLPAGVAAAQLLARFVRARGLLGVKSGWFELPLAEAATSLIHPFKVTLLPVWPRGIDPVGF